MRKTVLFLVLCLAPFGFASTQKKDFKTTGLVLEVDSLSKFEVDEYEVHCLPSTSVLVERSDGSSLVGGCREAAIHPGAEVEVTGTYDEDAEQIDATEIIAKYRAPDAKVTGMVLIERAPELHESAEGWSGDIEADGRTLRLTPQTEVRFAREKDGETVLQSLRDVGPDVWAAYAGIQQSDGKVKLERVAFSRNVSSVKEQRYRSQYGAHITEPDYTAHKDGLVTAKREKSFRIVANQNAQAWIARFGEQLVPEFQRKMAEDDARKIHFRFYVALGLKYAVLRTPDGGIFVSAAALARLGNEAQLAAVLGAEIAAMIQEDDFRLQSKAEWSSALCWGSLGAGFLPMGIGLPITGMNFVDGVELKREWTHLSKQNARLGTGYAEEAGFDPREARAAYKELSRKVDTGFKLTGRERSFYRIAAEAAAEEIATKYSRVSGLQVGEEPYRKFLASLK